LNERFLLHIRKTPTCWIWTGTKITDGYGGFQVKGKQYLTHRFSYNLFIGQIPEGLCVLHTCDNRLCVNPNHLWLGTKKDNSRDRDSKNRQASGPRNGRAKLSLKQVQEIRQKYRWYSYGQERLAKEYKVSRSAIEYILMGKTWG